MGAKEVEHPGSSLGQDRLENIKESGCFLFRDREEDSGPVSVSNINILCGLQTPSWLWFALLRNGEGLLQCPQVVTEAR